METIDIKLISSDSGVDKKVLEVYEYLKMYQEAKARTDWIDRRNKAWDAIENKMWEEGEEQEMRDLGQIPFVINKLVKGVQASGAVVTNQDPQMLFHPIGSSDLYVAELIKRAFDVVWAKNEGKDVVYDIVEETDIGAHGWVSVKLDKSRDPFGTIVFEDEPPDDIYFDAESRKRDYSDTHVIKAKPRNFQYIKDNYPDIKENDLYFIPVSKTGDSTSSGVEGEDNYTIDATPDTIDADVKSKQKIIWEIEAWMLKTVVEDWTAELDDKGQPKTSKMQLAEGQKPETALKEGQLHWKRRAQKRVQRIIVGKKLVSEITNPLGEDSDNQPVMALIGLKSQRTRNAYSMSKTMYARDINREKNKRRIQAVAAVSNELNAPVWFYDGVTWHNSTVKDGTANPGTPGTYAKISKNAPANPIGRLTSGNSNIGALVGLEDRSDREIDDIYDTHDVMKGKFPEGAGGQVSGRLVLALQDMGGMMSGPALRRLESCLVRLAKGIVSLMLTKWPRYMWERLLEEDEKIKAPERTDEFDLQKKMETAMAQGDEVPEEQQDELTQMVAMRYQEAIERIRPKDPSKPPGLSLIDVDIAISAGSSLPTNRMAKGQLAIEYAKAGIYDAEAALEYIDDPNKDKIVARMEKRAALEAEAALLKKVGG